MHLLVPHRLPEGFTESVGGEPCTAATVLLTIPVRSWDGLSADGFGSPLEHDSESAAET